MEFNFGYLKTAEFFSYDQFDPLNPLQKLMGQKQKAASEASDRHGQQQLLDSSRLQSNGSLGSHRRCLCIRQITSSNEPTRHGYSQSSQQIRL